MTMTTADVLTEQVPVSLSERRAATGVRRFVEADIPAVTSLHRRVSAATVDVAAASDDVYRQFFEEVFLRRSRRGITSLVFADNDGAIAGFQGVHARQMMFQGRPVTMAICSHFVVDPKRRGVPGVRLLKAVMDGPQDLTLADESNEASRRLWEWCGGTTTLLYSMHWLRPLRVAETGVSVLFARKSPRLAALSRPVARAADAAARFLRLDPFRVSAPTGTCDELDEATLAARLPEVAAGKSLRPDYGDGSLAWILNRAATRSTGGEFRKVLVRNEKQKIAGWYLYFANEGGIGEVLQIAAPKESAGLVIDHLLNDAMQRGVVALAGRLDPAIAAELSERNCVFYRRGNWALVHARDPKILHSIERGDAFLSRLDGEWCLRFR